MRKPWEVWWLKSFLCKSIQYIPWSLFIYSVYVCINPQKSLFCEDFQWCIFNITSTHYLLHCLSCSNRRMTLLNKINCSILEFSDAVVAKILLFRDNTLSDPSNILILNSSYLLYDLMAPFSLPDDIQKALSGISIGFFILLFSKLISLF